MHKCVYGWLALQLYRLFVLARKLLERVAAHEIAFKFIVLMFTLCMHIRVIESVSVEQCAKYLCVPVLSSTLKCYLLFTFSFFRENGNNNKKTGAHFSN